MTYEEIVKRIDDGLNKRGIYHESFENKPGKALNEVNAWTYWQGFGVRNPNVMIVGQDWGSLSGGKKFFDAIDEMQDGISDGKVQYFKYNPEIDEDKGEFATDQNLAKCLSIINYGDVLHTMYQDLFFTNFVPGYRKESKSTGGFKTSWVTQQVKQDFKDLITVLRPKGIICLGKDTFKQACLAYGVRGVFKGECWNDFLDGMKEPVHIIDEQGMDVYIFASAHPGYFGMKNSGEDKVYGDWKRINKWMLEMYK